MIRRDQLSWPLRIMVWLMGGRYGDFRDWNAIDAWTETIAKTLAYTSGEI